MSTHFDLKSISCCTLSKAGLLQKFPTILYSAFLGIVSIRLHTARYMLFVSYILRISVCHSVPGMWRDICLPGGASAYTIGRTMVETDRFVTAFYAYFRY